MIGVSPESPGAMRLGAFTMRHVTVLFFIGSILSPLFWGCESTSSSPEEQIVDEYLHIRAAWSPDGVTIAFSSLAQNATGIVLVDSGGGNLRSILSGDGVGLAWSPDGRRLAFTRGGYGCTMNADGDSLTQIAALAGAIRPAWSPDGSKIAFVSRDAGAGISLYDLKSDSVTQLLSYGNFPSWHPTSGEIIAFDSQFDAVTGGVIYTFLAVTPSTQAVRVISSFMTISECGFSRISPNGNTIIYSLTRPDDHVQIWAYDISLVQHKQLTNDGGDFAAWSPDGKKIVYTRTQEGDGALWIMNADGTNKHRLTKQ